jgi:hypothetical protein
VQDVLGRVPDQLGRSETQPGTALEGSSEKFDKGRILFLPHRIRALIPGVVIFSALKEPAMRKENHQQPADRGNNPYAALAAHKIGRKEKYAWIAAGLAVLVLLLCWWARSTQ